MMDCVHVEVKATLRFNHVLLLKRHAWRNKGGLVLSLETKEQVQFQVLGFLFLDLSHAQQAAPSDIPGMSQSS